jgi:hypothetical protein
MRLSGLRMIALSATLQRWENDAMTTADVKVGDRFIYTTPSGRELGYEVTALDVLTPQGRRAPQVRSDEGRCVFLTDELLEQDWWRPEPARAL